MGAYIPPLTPIIEGQVCAPISDMRASMVESAPSTKTKTMDARAVMHCVSNITGIYFCCIFSVCISIALLSSFMTEAMIAIACVALVIVIIAAILVLDTTPPIAESSYADQLDSINSSNISGKVRMEKEKTKQKNDDRLAEEAKTKQDEIALLKQALADHQITKQYFWDAYNRL